MKKLSLTIVALLMLQQAALAQGGQRIINTGAAPQSNEDMTNMRAERASPSHSIVDKSLSCAPDQTELIWGPTNALVGYRCVAPIAGG